MKPIRALFALPCLMLAACQVTTFAAPPLAAASGCDPALVGEWWSVADDGSDDADGEVRIVVDAACTLTFTERETDGTLRTDPSTPLRVARQGDHAYAWVDAAWAVRHVGEDTDPSVPASDIVLVRYAVDADALRLWSTDDKAIAHAIVDDEISGTTTASGGDIANRVFADAPPAILDRPSFFDAEAATLRRVRGD